MLEIGRPSNLHRALLFRRLLLLLPFLFFFIFLVAAASAKPSCMQTTRSPHKECVRMLGCGRICTRAHVASMPTHVGMRVRGLAGQHTIAHLRTRAHGCQASARKHSYKPRHKINESAFVAPFFASLPPGFCLGATDASCVSNFFASASLSKQAPAIFAQRCGTHSSVEVRNVCHTDPRRHPRLQWSR
jgi:hypothetical protein